MLNALVDLTQCIMEILCLLFQAIKLLFRRHCRGERSGLRYVRVHGTTPGRIAHSPSCPARQARRIVPVSPAATAASAPAPITSSPGRIHKTRHRITGAISRGSSRHRSHSGGTCSISTWHNSPLSNRNYSLVILVPHSGHVFPLHGWPATCGTFMPHFGQRQFPPGPAANEPPMRPLPLPAARPIPRPPPRPCPTGPVPSPLGIVLSPFCEARVIRS